MKKIGLIVKESSQGLIENKLKSSEAFLILKYSGLSSPEMTQLRQGLIRINSRLFVVKNSVARRALKESGLESMLPSIEEPCGFVFVDQEPVEASRLVCEFSRDHEKLKLGGGIFKDRVLAKHDIEALAKLPAKEVLRAQAVMALNSPISGIVLVLSRVLKKFVYCLDQVRQKKT